MRYYEAYNGEAATALTPEYSTLFIANTESMPRTLTTSSNSTFCLSACDDKLERRSSKADFVPWVHVLLIPTKFRRTIPQASATTCRWPTGICRHFPRAKKCPTTCHSLIKTRPGMTWMTLLLTSTQTGRNPSNLRTCEARHRKFLNCT